MVADYRVDVCREELLEAGYEGVQPLFATNRFDEALAFAKEKIPELKDSIEEYIAEKRREKILAYNNPKTRNAYPYPADAELESIRNALDKVPEDSLSRLPKCKHSPFRHAPQKQKKFDQWATQELLRHYPQEAVAWAVQALSPLGERMGQYGKRLVQEAAKTAER